MSLQDKIEAAVQEHNTLAAEVEEGRQKLLTLIGKIQAYQELLQEEEALNGEAAAALREEAN